LSFAAIHLSIRATAITVLTRTPASPSSLQCDKPESREQQCARTDIEMGRVRVLSFLARLKVALSDTEIENARVKGDRILPDLV
jgi:hypothetical protein